jgi:hypothetical protein
MLEKPLNGRNALVTECCELGSEAFLVREAKSG